VNKKLNWSLMKNNITREDLNTIIDFLEGGPSLPQGEQVYLFEKEWSEWLGVKYSVFVNSGSSANLITLAAMKHLYGKKREIIVPTLTWVSDITSVLHNRYIPVFVDTDPRSLGMNTHQVFEKLNPNTEAVFMSHIQGFNSLTRELICSLDELEIPLIEDVCESHGATFEGRKLGSIGLISNFSFYYGHHMTTIEGGMVCTNDEEVYQILLMMRSHGMVRESTNEGLKALYNGVCPELHPNFIFAYAGYNVRNTEIGAVLGRSQLKRLDENNAKRKKNLSIFLRDLDPDIYRTNFYTEGSCNYALPLILNKADMGVRDELEIKMIEANIDFRRGSAGGGNQLRQPYLKDYGCQLNPEDFPETEHIHNFGYYIGNYPDLEEHRIVELCQFLNMIKKS
jgi:CDP-4-dehydro-6-deoxyglucose reductase, E1